MLIEHLPANSATAKAMDRRLEWGTTEYLLAAVLDRLAELGWLYVSAHQDKGRKVKRPEPTPRPSDGEVVDAEVVDDRASGPRPYKPRVVPRLESPEQLAAWLRGG